MRRRERSSAAKCTEPIEIRTGTWPKSRTEAVRCTDGSLLCTTNERDASFLCFALLQQARNAESLLQESGRERINAVYSVKEQCRKEFQDEMTRLRNQFQSVGRKVVHRLTT